MRNDAFRDTDLIIILGTRTNYVIGHAAPPRFGAAATIVRIDIDPEEMGTSARNIDIPIVGDCKSVLLQLCEAVDARTADHFQAWRQKLADGEAQKRIRAGGNYPTDGDIHPLRLCEEIKNFMQREGDPLGRRAGDPQLRPPVDPDLRPRPPAQFRALRHDGRGAAVCGRRQGRQAQRAGHLPAGCEYVEQPEDIRPALQRAWRKVEEGMVGFVNVKTDYRARTTTVRFSSRET